MRFLRSAIEITRMEASLFRRFPKLRLSVLGIVLIPALYAFIYLSSVWDPASRTGSLPAAIVNLDEGVTYRGQKANLGTELVTTLTGRHLFGFTPVADEAEARRRVRAGLLSFALIVPRDFSANAVPGMPSARGRLVVYASEGNNYTGAGLARRFAAELGHQVNETLNEKRWELVLGATEGSRQSLARLRDGMAELRTGALTLNKGLAQAVTGTTQLASGSTKLSTHLAQAADGFKQIGSGLRTMDAKKPAAHDLQLLKSGAAQIVAGEREFGKVLGELESGARRLGDGAALLREESDALPLFGGKVVEAAGKLADGTHQLVSGLQAARTAHPQLVDATARLESSVSTLADGLATMSGAVATMSSRLPPDARLEELKDGGATLAKATQAMQAGIDKLHEGSHRLVAGLELLEQALPKDIEGIGGSPRGLAASVEPQVEIDAPVANNGAGFAPNFVPVALWLGAVMTAFIFHLRTLPIAASQRSRMAQSLGKLGMLTAIVLTQAAVVLAMISLALEIRILNWPGLILTTALASITFLLIIFAFTRAFGDTGKAIALILLIVQLSSAGGILPVELTGSFFRDISPWLPFTWVVRGFRASMFGAYDSAWLSSWLIVLGTASVAFLSATFIGQWKYVEPEEHRPAMDI